MKDKREENLVNFLIALGQMMRCAREYCGINYAKVSDVTDIHVNNLIMMERGEFENEVLDLYKVGKFYIDMVAVSLMCPGEKIVPQKASIEICVRKQTLLKRVSNWIKNTKEKK